MAIVDVVMPKLGESIMEATILKWHKNPGDPVKMDETLLDIATDKVDSEVPSETDGILEEVLYQANEVVPIGAVIARIKTAAEQQEKPSSSIPQHAEAAYTTNAGDEKRLAEVKTFAAEPALPSRPLSYPNRFYSPLVLNIAAREGVSLQELESIPGAGNEGRVTKRDILQYVEDRRSAGGASSQPKTHQPSLGAKPYRDIAILAPASEQTDASSFDAQRYSGNVEVIEMDRMRKLIAKHMVDSKRTSPHVTSFSEADVTNMVLWREKVKKGFEKRENEKITFTPLFIEAIVKCLKKYPWLNSSIDGDKLIVKKDINIGMATALPSGNLIVPVVKNADQLNLVGLAKQINALANAARQNKLKPEDTVGGTFTLTNLGTFGSIMGVPIINQPQVAILAAGAIKKKPVVIETAQGDSIAIRHMMYLSMSYDHRIIDGALGSTFLNAVAKELENFNVDREY
ncbi:MAG: 2-oxo acid dehydrogenase subunit E2 [Chitinophagaceae bacterium]|nr:2-oxo acid dehydrogenase subunit E2 [Chitinophagaceae bacterium]